MPSQQLKKNNTLSLYVKLSAILFLLCLSILVVACSGSDSSQQDPGTPVVTVTINLGQVIGSPTPPLKDYYCGGWATDTSPPFNQTSVVSVFGKFTHIVYGNPEGVGGATATATIHWPDGTTDIMTATTTSDGLAVFPVAVKASAINKVVTIQITFTAGLVTCSIPSAAYFTAILVSPTPSNTAMPSATISATPSDTPTPGKPTHCKKCTPTATPTP
jgi:hypothetical protein